MNDCKGWMGRPDHVEYVLATIGADKDSDGRFFVFGEAPIIGLDGDMVLSPRVEYSVGGKRASLVGLMWATSYGVKVNVI